MLALLLVHYCRGIKSFLTVDSIPEKVEMINNRTSCIRNDYIEKCLPEKNKSDRNV